MEFEKVDNLWGRVDSDDPHDLNALKALLTIDDNPLFDEEQGTFLLGLASRLWSTYPESRNLVFTVPTRAVTVDSAILKGEVLRPYQLEVAQTAVDVGFGVIKMPTSAGKSFIGAAIILSLAEHSVFFVPNLNLLKQMVKKFKDYGCRGVGQLGGGVHRFGKVTIADIRYVYAALKEGDEEMLAWLQRVKVAIYDEAHHIPSKTWMTVTAALSNLTHRIGLTATPYQKGGVQPVTHRDHILYGVFGGIIGTIATQVLKQEGFVAKANIYMIPCNTPEIPNKLRHNTPAYIKNSIYNKAFKVGIAENFHRNDLVSRIAGVLVAHSLRTLILVSWESQGKQILTNLESQGIRAGFIMGSGVGFFYSNGTFSEVKSDEILRQYIGREINVMIASPVLSEGFDLPGDLVEAMIVATAGRGPQAVLQRLGRALRPKPGENEVTIVDFMDNTHPFLIAQSRARVKQYNEEGHHVFSYADYFLRFVSTL